MGGIAAASATKLREPDMFSGPTSSARIPKAAYISGHPTIQKGMSVDDLVDSTSGGRRRR